MWCRYNVCPNCSSARYQSPASRKNPQSPICYPSIPLPISDTRDHAVKATQALISSILVPVIPATCVPVGPVRPCGRLSRHGKRDMFSSKDMYLVERHIQERRNGQRTCNTVSEEERRKRRRARGTNSCWHVQRRGSEAPRGRHLRRDLDEALLCAKKGEM